MKFYNRTDIIPYLTEVLFSSFRGFSLKNNLWLYESVNSWNHLLFWSKFSSQLCKLLTLAALLVRILLTTVYFSCFAHIFEQFGVHLHYFWPEILYSVKENKRRMHFLLTRSFLIKTKVKAWHLDVPSEKSLHIFMNGLSPKSLYRSCAVIHLYGPEYEIWADFGLGLATLKFFL